MDLIVTLKLQRPGQYGLLGFLRFSGLPCSTVDRIITAIELETTRLDSRKQQAADPTDKIVTNPDRCRWHGRFRAEQA
jgi:hypothetical protein